MKKLDYNVYFDKVLGCWYGKSIGGTVGAPVEGHKMLGDYTTDYWPSKFFPNDDLDIQVVWLEMLEEQGVYPTKFDYAKFWQKICWYNFAEYGFFLYNVQRGIHPPLSGRFTNDFYSECQGCPIRAEIWGTVSPGDKELASELARIDGELDHIGISVDAERFWAAAVAEAFFTNDMHAALNAARSILDDESPVARVYDDTPRVLEKAGSLPLAWRLLIRKYGHRDNSKALINYAFTLMALLAAKGDFKQTIINANNFGWDSDCTAATAGAFLGTLLGASKLPADWMERMGDRLSCDCNVRHKTALMTDFTADTCKVGIEMLERNTVAQIVKIPKDIMDEVEARRASRSKPPILTWDIDYCGDPVLPISDAKEVTIKIRAKKGVKLELSADAKSLEVTIDRPVIAIFPGEEEAVKISVRRQESDIIWDKNLIKITAKENSAVLGEFEFGLAGARPWVLYGPYWDAWRVDKSEVCPFKNDEVVAHPCHVGCGDVMSNNFVFLNREYLDEKALQQGPLPAEGPEIVPIGKTQFMTGEAAGYVGECAYYFCLELVSSEETEVYIMLGCDSPFKAWLDGELVCEMDEVWAWTTGDRSFKASFGSKPRRLVVKVARVQDDACLFMMPRKVDVMGDKMTGHSYIVDTFGYKIMKG
ncbi:MAG TPA: ADP-ribosylglycohydrolase family protein [Clostridia bacterium]|nr:ADP-ribosylglycohydrolase family protein [Clostridia bacterium]